MNKIILKISIIFLLLNLIGAGCKKEGDEWVIVNPSTPNVAVTNQLDLIFSENNNCLLNFQKDTVLHTIFVPNDFTGMDSCNNIPTIDLDDYSLIVGKIKIASVSDHISAITLTSNKVKDSFNLEVSIAKCKECYGAIGYIYFWRIYPNLNSKYKIEMSITES